MGKGTMVGLAGVLTFAAVAGACSGGDTPGHGGAGASAAGGGTSGGCKTDDDCAGQLAQTTPPNCAKPTCDPLVGTCSLVARDADGDGHGSADCVANDGSAVAAGDDCDDADPELFPGHPRSCSKSDSGAAIVWPAGAPVGTCAYGSQSCKNDGSIGACAGAVPPAARDCASPNDNDCDGLPDDTMDVVCACDPGMTYDCSSDSMGTIVWPSGSWGDGPAPGSICHKGTALCGADGHLMTCGGAARPQSRDCASTSDNDCDGAPDANEWTDCSVPETENGASGSCHGHYCSDSTQCVKAPAQGHPADAQWCHDDDNDNHYSACNTFCDGFPLGSEWKQYAGGANDCDDSDPQAYSNCLCGPIGSTASCACGGNKTCNAYPSAGVRDYGQCSASTVCSAGQTQNCPSSPYHGCTDTQTCSSTGCNWGSCTTSLCSDFNPRDFASSGPLFNAYSSGPNCFGSDNTYGPFTVCPTGYHITSGTGNNQSCKMTSVPADGFCDTPFVSPTQLDIHVHANNNCTNTATAQFLTVACRKDGF